MFCRFNFFFFNDTATTEIYTLSLHDAFRSLPRDPCAGTDGRPACCRRAGRGAAVLPAVANVGGGGAGAQDSGRHDAGTVHGHVGRLRSGGGGRRHAGAHRDGTVRAAPCRVEARAGGAWSRSRSLAAGTWVRPCWPVSWRTGGRRRQGSGSRTWPLTGLPPRASAMGAGPATITQRPPPGRAG